MGLHRPVVGVVGGGFELALKLDVVLVVITIVVSAAPAVAVTIFKRRVVVVGGFRAGPPRQLLNRHELPPACSERDLPRDRRRRRMRRVLGEFVRGEGLTEWKPWCTSGELRKVTKQKRRRQDV